MVRTLILVALGIPAVCSLLLLKYSYFYSPIVIISWAIFLLALYDVLQTPHTILKNFPIIGHFRYIFESIRPEINQYFVESNSDGAPFNRIHRSMVYQRAKNVNDTIPFGTQLDTQVPNYEWVNHSLNPKHVQPESLRVVIGGDQCQQKYSASLLNISAMSFGALSQNAIMALNRGAKMGNFAHNTGEGGISKYHLHGEADIIWQIGTGYFGCRDHSGRFDAKKFKENALRPSVKMIEIKLSQGAKPGHGGILPKEKLTPEIAEIRGVPMGNDVISPPAHTAFSTPLQFCAFIKELRELSGGKPIGFKLCVGKRREFLAICKAMIESNILPDYIVVDGSEGGTGAAPVEFSNYLGTPIDEALIFVRNALVGFGLKDQIKIIASGKIVSAFDIIKKLGLGADLVNSARAMMFSIGCIQALRCHSNQCPAGVATQNPYLYKGLDVKIKSQRAYQFHKNTLRAVAELIGAMGNETSEDIKEWHILRRINDFEVKNYSEIYQFLQPGDLLKDELPANFARAVRSASSDRF